MTPSPNTAFAGTGFTIINHKTAILWLSLFSLLSLFFIGCHSTGQTPASVNSPANDDKAIPVTQFKHTAFASQPMQGAEISDSSKFAQQFRQATALSRQGKMKEVLEISLPVLEQLTPNSRANQIFAAKMFHMAGQAYLVTGKPDSSLYFLEKSLNLRQQMTPLNKVFLAEAYSALSVLTIRSAQFEKGESYINQALSLLSTVTDPPASLMAALLTNQANSFIMQGKVEESRNTLMQARQYASQVEDPAESKIIQILNSLGLIEYGIGEYELALKTLLQADSIQSHHPDLPVINTANIKINMGNVYQLTGKYDEALDNYEQAIDAITTIKPVDENLLASAYNNMGSIYQVRGRLQEAMDYFQLGLQLRQKPPAAPPVEIGRSLHNIASVHTSWGMDEAAFEFYSRALVIFQQGPDPITIASTYAGLGNIHYRRDQWDEALQNYQAGLQLYQLIHQQTPHIDVARMHIYIGNVHKQRQQAAPAVSAYQEALRQATAVFGTSHPSISRIYSEWADLDRQNGDLSSAEEKANQALRSLGYQADKSLDQQALSLRDLVFVLSQQMDIYRSYYQQTEEQNYLQKIRQQGQSAINALNALRFEYLDAESKHRLIEESYSVFENLIFANFTAWEFDLY